MMAICGDSVKVLTPMDGYDGWDILSDEGFQKAEELCRETDHAHFAPPCRTLSRARRSDEYGTSKTLRSDKYPEGWGDEQTETANKVVAKMVALIMVLVGRGCTFSVENPWDSFIWLLRCMQKVLKLKRVSLTLVHQCAYGAPSQKPTGILSDAAWMKEVNLLCHQVRWHHHLKGGLAGLVWSYVEERMVWRTSLAAEYPCGLTVAWCRALLGWLDSEEGIEWMAARSYVRAGKWKNVLLLQGRQENDPPASETAAEKRERENHEAIGGLKFAKRAVLRSSTLRAVGAKVRAVVDNWITDDMLVKLEADLAAGIDGTAICELRRRLCGEFQVEFTDAGFPVALWRALLTEACDSEASILPEWLESGFPLGIESEIEYSGVFPMTDCDTASVEASRLHGTVMQDEDGQHVNYSSFVEAGDKAQEQLDKLHQQGRAEVLLSWHEVRRRFGADAQLTKLACIVKTKADGSEKVRLVVDCRRSGVNGQMHIRERVTLPKITDVANSLQRLLEANANWNPTAYPELLSADFSDAFHMLKLKEGERKYLIVKGADDVSGKPRYYVMKVVVFGVAPGPLLWGRLAAAAMRLAQSVARLTT